MKFPFNQKISDGIELNTADRNDLRLLVKITMFVGLGYLGSQITRAWPWNINEWAYNILGVLAIGGLVWGETFKSVMRSGILLIVLLLLRNLVG